MKKLTDIKLTPEGLENLKDEYKQLEEKRPEVLARMVEAREQGDLSENAGYHASRDELASIDVRLQELKLLISFGKVVKSKKSNKAINIGSKVEVDNAGKKLKFVLVGQLEADPLNGKLSNTSPIGAALIGKKVGDVVTIEIPDGKATYKILEID